MTYHYHNACYVRDALVFPLFSVFVWTGENDSNTLRMDMYFLENGGKNLRFQTKTDTCGRGLSLLGNGKGKAINSTVSVRTRAQSLLFSCNPNSLQSFKQLGPLENRKKSEIMGSLFFQRHFRGRRCYRIVRSLKFHLGAKRF